MLRTEICSSFGPGGKMERFSCKCVSSIVLYFGGCNIQFSSPLHHEAPKLLSALDWQLHLVCSPAQPFCLYLTSFLNNGKRYIQEERSKDTGQIMNCKKLQDNDENANKQSRWLTSGAITRLVLLHSRQLERVSTSAFENDACSNADANGEGSSYSDFVPSNIGRT